MPASEIKCAHFHGTGDMIRRCREAGLRELDFRMSDGFTLTLWRPKKAGSDLVADPVADPVDRLILVLGRGTLAPSEIQQLLHLKHRPTFRENYLHPALQRLLVEMTVPDKPTSRLQRYRLTTQGKARLATLLAKGGV